MLTLETASPRDEKEPLFFIKIYSCWHNYHNLLQILDFFPPDVQIAFFLPPTYNIKMS